MHARNSLHTIRPRYQSGMITTFTGVMILVLLTLMMFFAMRVNVNDQRVSSNEMRQKRAFHAAESGIQHAKEYFKANKAIVASIYPDTLGDGTDGWLAPGNERWEPCGTSFATGSGSHPCYSEPNPAARANLYYWSFGSTGSPPDPASVPVATDALKADTTETVDVQALLCLMVVDADASPPVQGCSTNTTNVGDSDYVDGSHYLITLVAQGQADCNNGANCTAEALVRDQVANFGANAGGQAPAVPLTTKNMFPPTGAAEVVANPNGGGIGVPISVWMNNNPSCNPDGNTISPSQGSWATCEAHEWYELENIPDDIRCPGSCSCAVRESLSYTHGTSDILGIDLVDDENFPCDLFQFYFGTPRDNYESVKSYAKVLTDCSTLGPSSNGIYWISGTECNVQSNAVIGSARAPVLLISAAGVTSLQGGATIYGVLYVSDVEDGNAYFESRGNNIVYGQVILDAEFGSYNGTFQIVYNETLITRLPATSGIGNVLGGWADFHTADWESWQ